MNAQWDSELHAMVAARGKAAATTGLDRERWEALADYHRNQLRQMLAARRPVVVPEVLEPHDLMDSVTPERN